MRVCSAEPCAPHSSRRKYGAAASAVDSVATAIRTYDIGPINLNRHLGYTLRVRSVLSWARDQRDRYISHPGYATLTTISGAVAGLIGSVYGTDVAGAFPFIWKGPWRGLSGHAGLFWFSLVLFGLMFYYRQRHDDRARERLATTSNAIAELVATLPPKSFRAQYAAAVKASRDAQTTIMPRATAGDATADDLAALVRSLLRQIAELACVYDDSPTDGQSPATYAANVMLFVSARTTEPVFSEHVLRTMKFLPADQDLRKLRGALWMSPELFATSTSPDVSDFPGLTLPVPRDAKRNGRYAVLPGAPRAFAEDMVDGYLDAHTLAEFCRSQGDFLESVLADLNSYFVDGPGKSVRSFISRPLAHNSQPLGVLNLHSSMRDILGPDESRRHIFQSLITPLFLDLGEAVAAYVEKSGCLELAWRK